MPLSPNSAAAEALVMQGGMPPIVLPDGRKIERPNREWLAQDVRWRWLLDSLEGGERYRQAWYGWDSQSMPIRNLIRHKREYPLPQDATHYSPLVGRPTGTDMAAQATDDDYELRRARTPVPTFLSQTVDEHLSKVYNQEVKRVAPTPIVEWWKDVDGRGASIDQWMADTVAPLVLVFGQLDLIVENPATPDGEEVRTRADEIRLGLDGCIASYILPNNLPWWRIDRRGLYLECIVREVGDDADVMFRHWDETAWTLYDDSGEKVETVPHHYGRVPIVRVFDKRRPSCQHVGMPRYEAIAEIQREYYNRDSELILSDTTQAHPTVQGPEDFVKADVAVPIGPGYILPKKKDPSTGSYEGWEYIDPPKGAADSLRTNKSDLRDEADRIACLTKPAGAAGTNGQTVAQSGLSKRLDQSAGNELLGKIAKTLQRVEETLAELAADVLGVDLPRDGEEAFSIQYPAEFDLANADELMSVAQAFELLLSQVGDAPAAEFAFMSKAARLMTPGLDDAQYDEIDEQLKALIERRGVEKQQQRESMTLADEATAADAPDEPTTPAGTPGENDQPEGE